VSCNGLSTAEEMSDFDAQPGNEFTDLQQEDDTPPPGNEDSKQGSRWATGMSHGAAHQAATVNVNVNTISASNVSGKRRLSVKPSAWALMKDGVGYNSTKATQPGVSSS